VSVELRFSLSVHNEGIATHRETALPSVHQRSRVRSFRVLFAYQEIPVFGDLLSNEKTQEIVLWWAAGWSQFWSFPDQLHNRSLGGLLRSLVPVRSLLKCRSLAVIELKPLEAGGRGRTDNQ
jgi:hypothetical protein